MALRPQGTVCVVGAEENNILNFDQHILKNKVMLVKICAIKRARSEHARLATRVARLRVARDARLPRQGELLGALSAAARHAVQRGAAQAELGVGADVVVRADAVELARRQHHLVYVSEWNE